MKNKPVTKQKKAAKTQVEPDILPPQYDSHIIPAETAARQKREGDTFMHIPSKADEMTNDYSITTTSGYTVDKEGLINNFAVESEMYVNQPGDLQQQKEEEEAERINELKNLNQDEDGKLTMEQDLRGKGPGLV